VETKCVSRLFKPPRRGGGPTSLRHPLQSAQICDICG